MSRRTVWWALAATVALAGAAVGMAVTRTAGGGHIPRGYRGSLAVVAEPLPDFALRDQDGRLVRTADLRGRVTVLTFLDTRCTESCPIIAAQIARTLDKLGPVDRTRVTAVAISVDPASDTPARIHAFLRRNHAERGLRYLSGPEPLLRPLWREFHILSAVDSGDADTHSAPVRIYGRDGGWLATQRPGSDLSPDNLAHDVRLALGGGPRD